MRRWFIFAAALLSVFAGRAAMAASAGLTASAHTAARLLLSHDAVRPGETVWAGIQLTMDSGWHTYWRNPGESGIPTTVTWTLPDGVTAGELLWPVPEKQASGGLVSYVYNGEVVLLAPLRIGDGVKAGSLAIQADVRWLECQKLCVKGSSVVSRPLTVVAAGGEMKVSSDAARLETARGRLPSGKPVSGARAWWDGTAKDGRRGLILEWRPEHDGALGEFLPFASKAYDVLPATERVTANVPAGVIRLRKIVQSFDGNWPAAAMGLVVEQVGAAVSGVFAFQAAVPIAETATAPAAAPAAAAPATASEPAESTTTAAAAAAQASEASEASEAPAPAEEAAAEVAPVGMGTLLLNLGLAFVGGLILNLMPCVLPVIALKILGFVNQSQGSPGAARRLGLIYGLGVLTSMLAMAGFVIAVKSTGKIASWGMQFQNPFFVVAITTLVLLVALNLFGVFEVSLGDTTMGRAGELAAREGGAGAFFNGVLAVVLATPCTAPFLGVALGFAFAQPAAIIVLMFSSVAVGLALPYVLLSAYPRLLKFMPKPGLWMEQFKVAMGFPMIATALWLLTVSAVHFGMDGVFWIGIFLVMVAVGAWVWGQFVQRGRARRSLAAAIALIFVAGGYVVALETQLHWRAPGGKIQWQPWSADAVAAARKEGRPILVDFTAVWCATCQANKKTSIEIASVRQRLTEINAVTLIGDFSAEDEIIAKELQKFGRAGVPLVLVYPKDASKPPLVLPEVLTPGIVLEALDKAAQ